MEIAKKDQEVSEENSIVSEAPTDEEDVSPMVRHNP
jgi:hypothetical protein